jgi:hypothetical protein
MAAQIEIASNGWVRRMLAACFPDEEELLRFLRQRNGIYGPLTAPYASRARAENIADWYQFVTVIDSFVSDRSSLGADDRAASAIFDGIVTEFPDHSGSSHSPYVAAARDLWRRITPGLSPVQAERLVASLRDYLHGCAVEIRAKLNGEIVSLETCMAVRVESFGCGFLKLLTEYAAEVDMSGYSDLLADAHHNAMCQLILVNDLLSWRKEYNQEDVMTAMRVLCERDGLPLQDAIHKVCELITYHERAYLESRDRILSANATPDVRAYLNGLDYLIAGSQEFEYLTPRYFGDGFVWDGATSGWLSLTAPVTRFQPEPAAR